MRVSVLITCYQHERYIARALDSVLEQDTRFSYEVLVGDDASTDGSRAIIAGYVEAHPDRIRAFFPATNLGLDGKAILSELLKRARGEYLAMLDGDDYWTSAVKLRRQVSYLEAHPECAMCFHNVIWRHEHQCQPDKPYNSPEQASEVGMYELIAANPVASCSRVFRRQAIDPLPGWFFEQLWGDWQLNLLASRQGKIHYLPDLMAVHLTHPNGMWSRLSRLQALEGITTCQQGFAPIIPPELEWRRRQGLGDTWFERAVEHARLRDRAAARRCLRESFRLWPVRPRRLRPGGGEKRRLWLWLRLNAADVLAIAGDRRRAARLFRDGRDRRRPP